VAEWTKAAALKAVGAMPFVGSNPTVLYSISSPAKGLCLTKIKYELKSKIAVTKNLFGMKILFNILYFDSLINYIYENSKRLTIYGK
jgi:hypothetical protein